MHIYSENDGTFMIQFVWLSVAGPSSTLAIITGVPNSHKPY